MEPTPTPPHDAPHPTKRRPRVLIIAVGAAIVTIGLLLAASLAGDGDNHNDRSDRGETAATTAPDEQATATTVPEPGAGGTGPAQATTTIAADPQRDDVFDDGRWRLGQDLEPGRYIATDITGAACDWARLADNTGETVVAAEAQVANQAIVDILPTDTAFRSRGCGTWTRYTPPDPPPATTIDAGDWVVGEQIQPGAYLVARTTSCHWTRATGFEHTTNEIVQTDGSAISLEGPMHTQLAPGERFTTKGCELWTKTG